MENNIKSPCTRYYSSLNLLKNITASRRDDLESIIYLIIKIYTGKLPWEKLLDYNIDNNFKKSKYKNKCKYIYIFHLLSKNISFEKIKNKIKLNEKLTKEDLIFIHETLTSHQICKGLPGEYVLIYDYIKGLNYKEKPDYKKIITLLKKAEKRITEEGGNILYNLEVINGHSIKYKFYWEIIIINYMFNKIDYNLIYDKDSIEELFKKYCLNINKYLNLLLSNVEQV